MIYTLSQSFGRAFLGQSPGWYKYTIVAFLIANPILLLLVGPVLTGWVVLGEFILTLAMALRCYPLQPGGLIAIEAALIGLTTPESIYEEVTQAFPVILLLIFMVAGIYFLRDLHGALLDADLLLEVYLAMTGGQGALTLDDYAASMHTVTAATRAIRPAGTLVVLRATEQEIEAHEALLRLLDKASAGRTAWRLFEPATPSPTPAAAATA